LSENRDDARDGRDAATLRERKEFFERRVEIDWERCILLRELPESLQGDPRVLAADADDRESVQKRGREFAEPDLRCL
jgi:hypothetical protein